jgi:hypothetical protein
MVCACGWVLAGLHFIITRSLLSHAACSYVANLAISIALWLFSRPAHRTVHEFSRVFARSRFRWITCGMFADFFTVAARTGEEGSGMMGISLILVERDRKGVSTRPMDCMGVKGSGTA